MGTAGSVNGMLLDASIARETCVGMCEWIYMSEVNGLETSVNGLETSVDGLETNVKGRQARRIHRLRSNGRGLSGWVAANCMMRKSKNCVVRCKKCEC